MENTPIGCDSDLLTILGLCKNASRSRSVNIFQRLSLNPNSTKTFLVAVKAPPRLWAPLGECSGSTDLFRLVLKVCHRP